MIHRRPMPVRCALSWRAVALAAVTALAGGQAVAAAPRFGAGPITVSQPWSRATPGGATVAVGYLVVGNAGDAPDRLVSVTVAVAGRAGLHSMAMADGVMTMRALPDGIVVPPHGQVALAPGGDHLMFEALKAPLKAGGHFAGTLVFEHAGPVPVVFTVEPIGARSPGAAAPEAAPMTMH